jgi:hypothetical protein
MTNIEKKLMKRYTQNIALKNLVNETADILQNYKENLLLDRAFADSWTQSLQISKKLDDLDVKSEIVTVVKRKLNLGENLSLQELTSLKKIVFHPMW